jgi:CheY-like chemotaxis protein
MLSPSFLAGADLRATSLATAPRPTVLVVEDNPDLLNLLRRTIECGGFDVITAQNGDEALDHSKYASVDLVVTDILMPKMDGFELIRTLRRKAPHLPIVAISGINDAPHYRKLAVQSGAAAALCKPVDRGQLVALLHSLHSAPR